MIIGEEIWEALLKNEKFTKFAPTKEMQTTMRLVVDEIPDILKDVLEKDYDFKTLSQAKLIYLQFFLKTVTVEKIGKVLPSDLYDGITIEQYICSWSILMKRVIGFCDKIVKVDPDFMKQYPEMEEEISESWGVSEEDKDKTIAEILITNPFAVICT